MRSMWTAVLLCAALAGCAERDEDQVEQVVETDLPEEPAAVAGEVPVDAVPGGGLLDPDAATPAELQAIPGIDVALADSLVARRPYGSMLAIDSVLAGRLSEAERDTVYARMWKPLDPNTASDAEILLIPGVGERMLHEFREYRPWRSVAQFRREIGKYVDDEEVARLERYIRIQAQ